MAIKTYDTLIKLHKRRIDEARRVMQKLEEDKLALEEINRKLQEDLLHETALVAENPMIGRFYASYAAHNKARQERIADEKTNIDEHIEQKREIITEEYGEQKKFEIAREQMKKRRAAEAARLQQQRFDEIGAQQYRRSQRDNT